MDKRSEFGYDVILTVPHYCVVSKTHDPTCDFRTKLFANKIYNELVNLKGAGHVHLFITDVERKDCDLNRANCRYTAKMRIALSKELKRQQKLRKSRFLLFDIHAFEGGVKAFGFKPGPSEKFDVVLLYLEKDLELGLALQGTMFQNKVNAIAWPASDINDIMVEAQYRGGKTVLLELKEEMSADSALFKKIVKSIKEAVIRMESAEI